MALDETSESHEGSVTGWLKSLDPDQSDSETLDSALMGGSETSSRVDADAARIDLLGKDDYRAMNLSALGIRFIFQMPKTPIPDWVTRLIARAQEARPNEEDRLEELKTRYNLGHQTFFSGRAVCHGTAWDFFQYLEFRSSSYPRLTYDFEQPPLTYDVEVEFKQHTIPHDPSRNWIKMATPKPDLIFGYETSVSVFPQLATSEQLWRLKDSFYVNNTPLLFPYLVWNGKSWGHPNNWKIVNRCLGDSAACIHTNKRIQHGYGLKPH
ncbi:hypothetical protein GGR53DRAFT_503333 [Hypoxylon sp. FL1150]|nr:hypothetical protein GGR53DRAFT_503333 [Hypoxylon sp. FL1150]